MLPPAFRHHASWLGSALLLGTIACRGTPRDRLPARTYHLIETGIKPPGALKAGIRVDLYLPAAVATSRKPRLLVYAIGGLWSMPDSGYMVGAAIGDAMQRRGVATAIVRFALADGYLLRRCAEDVARLLTTLAAQADEHGYDAARIVLGGHATGALLVSDLALDGSPLRRVGLDPARLGGVLILRGLFDLSAEGLAGHPQRSFYEWALGGDAAARAAASPISRVSSQAPPLLILSGGDDVPGYPQRARAFAKALERAGAPHVQSYVVPDADGDSLPNLAGEGNPTAQLVAEFVRGDATPEPIEGPWAVKQIWSRRPPLSSEPFWAEPSLVKSYPVDARFRFMLQRIFEKQMYELKPWPGTAYHAVDLLEYLERQATETAGKGDHLVVTNLRDERLFLSRKDLLRHRPRIVVGLDDERNLYRLFASYRMNRQYSWVDKADLLPPKMIRPVGAFLYFPGEVPKALWNGTFASFALTPLSFRWQHEDPLAAVRDLPNDVFAVLTGPSGCLYCHAFRGSGARSHHLTAERAQPFGAFALALEEYPPTVLHDFLFDQERVAKLFGVNPLKVDEPRARALYALVQAERAKGARPPVLGPLEK
jgi:acetyl esterase/lipase